MLDGLTLDQIETFLHVAEGGGFSSAAKQLRKSPSAIGYVIQKMEDQLRVPLFDRTTYRATLTDAGRTLLPKARRVIDEMQGLRVTARSIAAGLEPEMSLAVDSMFPIEGPMQILREFQERFPTVQLRLYVDTFGAVSQMVHDEIVSFGITSDFANDDETLSVDILKEVRLIMVASPDHLLSGIDGQLQSEAIGEHVQLVLTDRTNRTAIRDWSVYSARTWRIGDLNTKLSMLRAGFGFGSLPEHIALPEIAARRLCQLNMANGGVTRAFPIALIRRVDQPFGPAGRWLSERLVAGTGGNGETSAPRV